MGYKEYRDQNFTPVTNIGTQKLVYMAHRDSAAPRPCDPYRPFFSSLYLSQELNFGPYIPYIVLYFSTYICRFLLGDGISAPISLLPYEYRGCFLAPIFIR